MTQTTQTHTLSLRSIALCFFSVLTSASPLRRSKSSPSRPLNPVSDANKQGNIPDDLLTCIQTQTAVPEVKWTNGGNSVISIYNAAALMIRYSPGSDQDKQVTWGVSSDAAATIKIFNATVGMQADAAPLQSLNLLPAVHSLVWDQEAGVLWGAGSSGDPAGEAASTTALNGYRYARGSFATDPTYEFNVAAAIPLQTEWNNTEYNGSWDGGHDMTGVPGRRQLLLSSGTDLHVFDIASQTVDTGSSVVSNYLPGFTPVDSRVGTDGGSLPRSDVKSLSMDGNYNVLYIQAGWQNVTSYQINVLEGGKMQPDLRYSQQVYRARWFADTPTWPKARLHSSQTIIVFFFLFRRHYVAIYPFD
ncbi:hypothetical protein PWT90_06419 [Aphanocladium album]|nr:hypothetical protein PWT90_06419 [Aphanocladium album]